MKRFSRAIAVFAAVCLISLTGCGKNAEVKKPDELSGTISIAADTNNDQIIKTAAEDFKTSNPKVNINIQPMDTASLLSSKDEKYKKYDLYITGEENMQEILNLNSKLFYDLGSSITDGKGSILKSYMPNNSYNGKTYGYPWYTYAYVIYYRQDLFKEAGVPADDIKTWQQFIDAAVKVNKSTGKRIVTQESTGRLYSILLNQLRAGYVDKNGKSLISSNVSINAIGVLNSLYSEALLYNSNNISNEIKNDKVSSVIGNSSNMTAVSKSSPNMKGKWQIIQLPAFEPGGNRSVTFGGSSLLLNKDSKNSKLALDFLKFLSNDKDVNVKLSQNFGTVPICIDVSQSIDLKKENNFFNGNEYKLYEAIARLSPVVNYTSRYSTINGILEQNLDKLHGSNADINSIVIDMDEEINGV